MVPPQCGWLCKTEPLFPSGRGVWSGLVRWWVNVVDFGPALSRRRPDISCLSGHTVTNTSRCIFVFRVTCKPFLAGHCTMYVTEINKDIIINTSCVFNKIITWIKELRRLNLDKTRKSKICHQFLVVLPFIHQVAVFCILFTRWHCFTYRPTQLLQWRIQRGGGAQPARPLPPVQGPKNKKTTICRPKYGLKCITWGHNSQNFSGEHEVEYCSAIVRQQNDQYWPDPKLSVRFFFLLIRGVL